jgi:hypothetical protein
MSCDVPLEVNKCDMSGDKPALGCDAPSSGQTGDQLQLV